MSYLIARALWWLGAFTCNIGIPLALGVGVAGVVYVRAARGLLREWGWP